MGAHLGVIAANCAWSSLRPAIARRCGQLEEGDEIAASDWLAQQAGDELLLFEHAERCYLLDRSMVLSTDSDLIVDVAREVGAVVAAGGAETVSGTFYFTAADADGLRRLHFDCAVALEQPFDLGEPLASERAIRWRDLDGNGIWARFDDLGFSRLVLQGRAPVNGRRVVWSDLDSTRDRPLSAQLNAHHVAFEKPGSDDWLGNVRAVARGRRVELTAWQSSTPPAPAAPGLGQRLKGKFRRRS